MFQRYNFNCLVLLIIKAFMKNFKIAESFGNLAMNAIDWLLTDKSVEGCSDIRIATCPGMAIKPTGEEVPLDDVSMPRVSVREINFKDGHRVIECPSFTKQGGCANTYYTREDGKEIDPVRTVVERFIGFVRNRCAVCYRQRKTEEE